MMVRRVVGAMLTVAAIAAQPVMAQEHGEVVDVRGTWHMSMVLGTGLLELTADHDGVSGTIQMGDHGLLGIHSVTIEGHELAFQVTIEGATFSFLGMVDGDRYVGAMAGPGMDPVEFAAERRSP